MSGLSGGDGASSLGIEEVPVGIRIQEGKITAESNSGPKAGSVRLDTTDDGAELILSGTGRDRAVATLSRPEISSFRSALDGALADEPAADSDPPVDPNSASESPPPDGDDAAVAGRATIQRIDGGIGIAIDGDAVEGLDLPPAGDSRQVECTVRPDGVALVDLSGQVED